MKKTTWIGAAFFAAVIGYLVISSFHTQPFRCQLCITYNGRQDCRSATAQTREEARRAAASTACAQIASGVTETNQCENTPPDSINWGR